MSRPRILAVDDEAAILELLANTLESEGYTVEGVTTVAAFRERVREGAFEMFIIDLTLPDGNGFNLIRELRPTTQAGMIILTGRGSETDHVVGLEIGADDYVTKPFRPRELAARVNAVHRRSSAMQQAAHTVADPVPAPVPTRGPAIDHEFDGYRVSTSARQVWSPDGEEVMLTTAEFSVLVALLERRGRVLSRDQIMTLAKGRDWESYDRAIDGLVSRLRRKIPKPAGGGHYIRTVHSVGYVFGG
ncbi:MAG: response regulator transcription factor [Paracoccaceae bacterium]|nr:MAG: response regulator transcription factor [Paracoccaceae bacterium]